MVDNDPCRSHGPKAAEEIIVPTFQTLYDEPLNTARQYAMVISGQNAHVRQKAVANTTLQLMQVYAGEACYATLTPESQRLLIQASNNAGTNTPHVYFLPWARTSIYRIRPKAANTPGFDGNLFFTPNLDGCMVTIDGSADAPTIYHSNSAGMNYSRDEDEAMQRQTTQEGQFIMEQNLKIRNMALNANKFKTLAAKNPIVPTTPLKAPKDFDMMEYGGLPKQDLQENKFKNMDLQQEFLYGAVFGVRKNGEWVFYKQSFETVRKEWDELETSWVPFSKPTVVRKKILKYRVVSADQFWP